MCPEENVPSLLLSVLGEYYLEYSLVSMWSPPFYFPKLILVKLSNFKTWRNMTRCESYLPSPHPRASRKQEKQGESVLSQIVRVRS